MKCPHQRITLKGNDEDGLKSVHCEMCLAPMTRRVVNGGYAYYPVEEQPEFNILPVDHKLAIVEDLVHRGWDVDAAAFCVAYRHHDIAISLVDETDDLERRWHARNAWNPGPDAATRTGMYDGL